MEATARKIQHEINNNIEQLLATYKEFLSEDLPFLMIQSGYMTQLLLDVGSRIQRNPTKFINLAREYQYKSIQLFKNNIDYLQSDQGQRELTELVQSKITDQRFTAEEWQHNFFYKMLKDFYLLFSEFAEAFLECLNEVDDKIHDLMVLYIRNFVDALAPNNFLLTNPEVIKLGFEQGWLNLLKGMKFYIEDLIDNNGHFNVRMTNKLAFQIGENIANTQGSVIYKNQIVELIQYAPKTQSVHEIPLLIVPPFINKYYILDLNQEKSLVNWLVQQGFTVFLLSWVNPDATLRNKTYEDYVLEGIGASVNHILQTYDLKKINMLGYCVGGTLLACYLSYMKQAKQDIVNSVTYLTTLVDFEQPGEIGVFIDEQQISNLEHFMDKKGYFDGRFLMMTFNMLRPNDLLWPYFINNYLKGELPAPFDLLYWNSDSTHQPTAMYSFYLRQFYLNNAFKNNQLTIGGVPLSLQDIDMPIFYLSCKNDHITPWRSTFQGAIQQSGPTTFVLSDAGHVAGVVNPPHRGKYGFRTNDQLCPDPQRWYDTATHHKGSWWPYWAKWLSKQSGETVSIDSFAIEQPLYAAPGEYVKRSI